MKSFIPRIALFLVLIGAVSCSSNKQVEKEKDNEATDVVDMKPYYFPTAFDGKTRYYLYEDEFFLEGQDRMSNLSAKRVERSKVNELIFVEYQLYSDTVIPMDSSIVELRDDGLYYSESYFFAKNQWVAYSNTGKSKVIAWNWKNGEETHFNRSITTEQALEYDVDEMSFESTLSFARKGTLRDPIESNDAYVVLEGSSISARRGESKEFDLIYWDLEGVGLYYFEMKAEGYLYSSRLLELLSKEEYEEFF